MTTNPVSPRRQCVKHILNVLCHNLSNNSNSIFELKMPNIFISRRTEDKGIAEFLSIKIKLLSDSKYQSFTASEIPGGRDWKAEIHENLSTSNIFVLLYTLPQADWIWCLYEAAYFSGLWSGSKGDGVEAHLICLLSPAAS